MSGQWTRILWPAVVAVLISGGLVAPAQAQGPAAAPGSSTAPGSSPASGSYTALSPTRVLDTRIGTGAPRARVAAHHALALSVLGRGGVPTTGVAAVVLNVTVTGSTRNGNITAYPAGTSEPGTSNLDFAAGQTIANLVIAKLGTGGVIALADNSSGSVELVADVSGYYTAGTASAAAAFTALYPYRALDTRNGTGVSHGALPPGGSIALSVADGRTGHVPASGVSTVAMNVTVTNPSQAGNITVFPVGSDKPTTSDLKFSAHQTIPNLVQVLVGDGGRVWFTNNSTGTVDLVADVAGWYAAGSPIAAGAYGAIVNPARVLDSRFDIGANGKVAAHATVHLDVTGRGSVIPAAGMSSVSINLTVTQADRAGYLTAYADGAREPATSNLNFPATHSIENQAVVEVGADGDIALTNNSAGAVHMIAAITGYYLSSSLPLPPTSPGYYVRSLTGDAGHDATVMGGQACPDARAVAASGNSAPRTVVLDFGSQTVAAPVAAGGVQATGTSGGRVPYSAVVAAVRDYIAAWHRCAPVSPPVTVAVGTNSDGDWDHYSAATRAGDWWRQVVRPSETGIPSGFTISGASDMEPIFTATTSELDAWITAYTAAADHPLIEFGTLDGCPPTPGQSGVECSAVPVDGGPSYQAWDQFEAFAIAYGDAPGKIAVLPQVNTPAEAVQWQNVDITGHYFGSGGTIDFVGALTDHSAAPDTSLTVDQGWAYLYRGLSTDPALIQPLATASDLGVL